MPLHGKLLAGSPSANSYHQIELDWRAASAVGANNGGLTLWIDGVLKGDLNGADNDTLRIDRVRLGGVAGIDAGTRGTYYFDEFSSRRGDKGPEPTVTLTVNKTGTGNGTVTSNPAGIHCSSDCSEVYTPNTSVVLTAAAASGSNFIGWNGAGCSGTNPCTVMMTADTSVTANFDLAPNPGILLGILLLKMMPTTMASLTSGAQTPSLLAAPQYRRWMVVMLVDSALQITQAQRSNRW